MHAKVDNEVCSSINLCTKYAIEMFGICVTSVVKKAIRQILVGVNRSVMSYSLIPAMVTDASCDRHILSSSMLQCTHIHL